MMRHDSRLLALFASFVIATPGCWDDTSTTDTETQDSAIDTAIDTVVDSAADLPDTTETPSGSCASTEDQAIIDSTDITSQTMSCYMSCMSDTDVHGCITDCIHSGTLLSSACSGCYASLAECTVANCMSVCATSPDSDECVTCRDDSGCTSAFDACSG